MKRRRREELIARISRPLIVRNCEKETNSLLNSYIWAAGTTSTERERKEKKSERMMIIN